MSFFKYLTINIYSVIVLNTLWKLEVNNRKQYKDWMFSINFANFFFDRVDLIVSECWYWNQIAAMCSQNKNGAGFPDGQFNRTFNRSPRSSF